MLLSVTDFRPSSRFAFGNLTLNAAFWPSGRNDDVALEPDLDGLRAVARCRSASSASVASTYSDGSAASAARASSESVMSICATFAGS